MFVLVDVVGVLCARVRQSAEVCACARHRGGKVFRETVIPKNMPQHETISGYGFVLRHVLRITVDFFEIVAGEILK